MKSINYLNIIKINKDELDAITKDRLDFGFDSIYFRYSEVIEELSWFKEREAKQLNKPFSRLDFVHSKRKHFYDCLEQLVRAHEGKEY